MVYLFDNFSPHHKFENEGTQILKLKIFQVAKNIYNRYNYLLVCIKNVNKKQDFYVVFLLNGDNRICYLVLFFMFMNLN